MRLNLEKKSRIPDVGVGVSPENIAKKASVRNISRSQNSANLLHRVQIGRQSTMDAEDLVINDGSNGKAVENHVECLPQLEGVTTLALVVETVNSVDGRALVVATKHEEVLGVLNLVGKQEADALETLRATIDVVSKEQVVGLGREATVLKKTQEIRVLAVDVSNNFQWGLEFQEDGLSHENLSRLVHKKMNFIFFEIDLSSFAGLVASDAEESVNDAVHSLLCFGIQGRRHGLVLCVTKLNTGSSETDFQRDKRGGGETAGAPGI